MMKWQEGSVAGLRARGGFEVSIQWDKGDLAEAQITSLLGTDRMIRTDVPLIATNGGSEIKADRSEEGKVSFPTTAGETYKFTIGGQR
ncbi:glycoside hydrolase family 95-like protein [Paenibacillus sp. FA6]|uniref:glycoside hydrolase family 95-like protein n=1 Tax=Paenibacillus sp. FA6 TaxID=3413029 RepID=UPI003F65A835